MIENFQLEDQASTASGPLSHFAESPQKWVGGTQVACGAESHQSPLAAAPVEHAIPLAAMNTLQPGRRRRSTQGDDDATMTFRQGYSQCPCSCLPFTLRWPYLLALFITSLGLGSAVDMLTWYPAANNRLSTDNRP
jgi:hypothetical protein